MYMLYFHEQLKAKREFVLLFRHVFMEKAACPLEFRSPNPIRKEGRRSI